MNEQEAIDGARCTDLYTEDGGRAWHMIEREGGSISFYYTYADSSGMHYVVWDSMDGGPLSSYVQAALEQVRALHQATGALLAAVSLPTAPGAHEPRSEDTRA